MDSQDHQGWQAVPPPPPPPYSPPPPLKQPGKNHKKELIVLGIFIVIAIIVGSISMSAIKKSNDGGKTISTTNTETRKETPTSKPQTTTTPAPAPKAQTWQNVINLSGNGMQNSGEFILGSGQKQILYGANDTSGFGACYFGVYLVGSDGMPNIIVNTSEPGTGQSYIYVPAGTYHLEINAANCNWEVTLQEMK